MTQIAALHRDLLDRVLRGDGRAPREVRRAAFDNSGLEGPIDTLVEKVALNAYRVTDEDVAAARAAGYSEDQIFELVVCAAIGQATRQYETGMDALRRALEER